LSGRGVDDLVNVGLEGSAQAAPCLVVGLHVLLCKYLMNLSLLDFCGFDNFLWVFDASLYFFFFDNFWQIVQLFGSLRNLCDSRMF
jgi:hypothetical protein